MRAIHQLIILLAICLFLGGCKDNVNIICDDCNTLTCLVNGKKFVPGSKDSKKSILNSATYGDKKLEINAYDDQEYIGLTLNSADSLRVGMYQLSTYPLGTGLYSSGSTHYSTDTDNTGELTITKLEFEPTPVMEGIFHYECINKKAQRSISVTDGSFRVFFGRAK